MSNEKESRPIQTRSSAILATFHAILWILLLAMMWRFVPSFEKIFIEFDADMPQMTVLVLTLSHFSVRYWFLVVPLLAALWGGDLIVLGALGHDPKNGVLRWLWLVLMLLVPLGLMALTVLAMCRPLIPLIQTYG